MEKEENIRRWKIFGWQRRRKRRKKRRKIFGEGKYLFFQMGRKRRKIFREEKYTLNGGEEQKEGIIWRGKINADTNRPGEYRAMCLFERKKAEICNYPLLPGYLKKK